MTALEERLGYSFRNRALLETALTHSSYANENRASGIVCNERLEFLGDSVLGVTVADFLYRHFPDMPEGRMTRLRAELVCEQSLHRVALELHLGDYLRLGKGEEHNGGRKRASILSDAVEAVIAAMYLDAGMETAAGFIHRCLLDDVRAIETPTFTDYKTSLQELVQRHSGQVLSYELVGEEGPDHAKTFRVQVCLNGDPIGRGIGRTKKEAEQTAAANALAVSGGSFTAMPEAEQEELLAATVPARQSGAVATLRVSTRPDAVTEEKLARLRRYGVETVELGAQSMCDEVLRRSGRGHTSLDTVKAAKLVKDAGFTLILQMMTGLPGSDDTRDIASARAIAALLPDGVRVYPTVILRSTPLYDLWRAGEYREHTVEDAVRVCARILSIFEDAEIPVIRMGLTPSDELSGGAAAGGAYHPSGIEPGADAVLAGSPNRVSVMTGQHRCNLLYLQERFSLRSVRVCASDVPDGAIVRI